MRIIIVEDMPVMGDAIQKKIQVIRKAYPDAEISLFDRLGPALATIRTYPHPDLCFLDLTLPDSTFEETVAMVPHIDEITGVIIITGHSEDRVRALLPEMSEIEIITKDPAIFTTPVLLDSIARALLRKAQTTTRVMKQHVARMRELLDLTPE